MINKIYKRIHSQYMNFFKFFFYLRYVFAIFLISISLFLLIPKFFDYEKKHEIIKEYLINKYDLEIIDHISTKFYVFPYPNLSIKKADLRVINQPITLKTKDLKIFLNLNNIYNFENLKPRKIIFTETEIDLDIEQIKKLLDYFNKLKFKFDMKNLNLNLKKENKSLFKIEKINFSNYGYKKFKINGKIFDERFKAHFKNSNKDLHFKIINTGIRAEFKLKEKSPGNLVSGSSKVKFLKNYLKFDFNLNSKRLQIAKSNFKNDNLSIFFNGDINFNPFFGTNLNVTINDINTNFIKNISLHEILNNKKIIKKLNSNTTISYRSKRYQNNLIKNYYSKSNLTFGRLTFTNKIKIQGGNINCNSNSLLTEEYPRLNFVCKINLEDQKKFLKKFSIRQDIRKDSVNLDIEGNLNLLNKKINFKKINIGKNYTADKTDKDYFKKTFENILFDDDFFRIFSISKFKEFLLEII